MGYRKPSTREWWEEETAFIEREGKSKYPMGGFASYCLMQARFAKEDSFIDLEERILQARKNKENHG